MHKIQIGFEDNYYVIYLVKHNEGEAEALIVEEVVVTDVNDIRESIHGHWLDLLTSFLYN